jgi:hypothetical protein
MNRQTLTLIALAGIAATGCSSPFKRGGQTDTTAAAARAPSADSSARPADTAVTTAPVAPSPTAPARAVPAPVAVQPTAPRPATTAVDEPWTPVSTGTVSPGMDRDQVVGVWGPPVAERTVGDWTYLYYRNGCEASCGTFDVVFLQGGRVVDAIVRAPGHTYDGTSSSPPGRRAGPTVTHTGGTAE